LDGLALLLALHQTRCCGFVTPAQKATWACLLGAQFVEKVGLFD
jgi:hypothetical protein